MVAYVGYCCEVVVLFFCVGGLVGAFGVARRLRYESLLGCFVGHVLVCVGEVVEADE